MFGNILVKRGIDFITKLRSCDRPPHMLSWILIPILIRSMPFIILLITSITKGQRSVDRRMFGDRFGGVRYGFRHELSGTRQPAFTIVMDGDTVSCCVLVPLVILYQYVTPKDKVDSV